MMQFSNSLKEEMNFLLIQLFINLSSCCYLVLSWFTYIHFYPTPLPLCLIFICLCITACVITPQSPRLGLVSYCAEHNTNHRDIYIYTWARTIFLLEFF